MENPNFLFASVNAFLNSICALLLILGRWFILNKKEKQHVKTMLCAFLVSTLFLGNYVYYHLNYTSVKFTETGAVKYLYFFILFTHVVLATLIVPMVLRTLYLGYKDERTLHKKWAKWTWPTWLYVSVTGILVYLFLYVLF